MALLAPVARAAEPDAALETVVVVGNTPLPGSELEIDRIPAPVQTATAQDIDRLHALDLTSYLNRALGSVYVNDMQNNPLQPDVNYRGYTASPLLGTPQGLSVYMDGVRLNQPFGDVVSWDLIPRQAIASLTLIPGSNPVFGLNTLGGALALRTKDGYSDPGLSLGVNYGSHDRLAIEAELGGHADGGLYWYGAANRFKEDGWRNSSASDATQAFGKLGLRNAAGNVSLSASYADTDLNGNGLQEQQFIIHDYASIYTKPDNTRNTSYLLNLVATTKVSDTISVSGNVFYRNIQTHTLNADVNDDSLGQWLYQPNAVEQAALAAAGYTGYPTSGETQANTPFPFWRCIANILLNSEPNQQCNGLYNRTATDQHDAGFNAQVALEPELWGRDNHLVAGAGEVRTSSHFTQSSQFGYLVPDRGVELVAGPGAFADGSQDSANAFDARVDLHGTSSTLSLFLTDTLQLSSMVALTVSGRYDRTDLVSTDALTPEGDPGSLSGRHVFKRINPAAGLTVTPAETFTAYLGYTEGSRAPSVIELGCADPANPCKLPNSMAGDPPLDQVVTRTYEAGVRGLFARTARWNLGVFRADNRDDILFVADEQSGFGYFKNFGQTRRQGVEAGVSSRIGPLTVGANYTYLDATYRSAEEIGGVGNSANDEGAGFAGSIKIEPGDKIPLVPSHILKVVMDWQIVPLFSVNADAMNVAGSYSRGNENNEHLSDGVYYLGPGRTGGYTVVNLGAELRPMPVLKVFAQVNNVLDHQYFTGSQLGLTGFNAAGNFVAQPFAGPLVGGERPLLGSTFYAPGAPRSFWVGIKYALSLGGPR